MTQDLDLLYQTRFHKEDLEKKDAIWKVLCRDFFQRYVSKGDVVLDLACGTGEFINNIVASQRIGVDLRNESREALERGVRFVQESADRVDVLGEETVDCVFTSNFLEHLPDKTVLLEVFSAVKRVLRPGGRFLIMGPNIRFVPGAYWDFFDHHIPLSERSVAEGLVLSGFELEEAIDRFLPYSTKSRLPQAPWLVAFYLRLPQVWPVLGKQFFVVARKPLGCEV